MTSPANTLAMPAMAITTFWPIEQPGKQRICVPDLFEICQNLSLTCLNYFRWLSMRRHAQSKTKQVLFFPKSLTMKPPIVFAFPFFPFLPNHFLTLSYCLKCAYIAVQSPFKNKLFKICFVNLCDIFL